MRELELDGIHDDGEHVILVDSDSERYTLRIDKALRAAVRTDRPALGMIQAADAAPVRPREIQAMLRSGRSAEDIAEAADIPLEHVRRYEGPVLAEREWTAQRARTFPVGRGGPSLDEVVAERLAAREATEETAWDAWRRPDSTWTLELTFSAASRTRQAHWVADLDNRSVAPIDDEARWISDEDAPPEPTRGRARLQAVKSSVYDLEADGSFDEQAGPRRGRAPRPGERPVSGNRPSALDDSELDALNARRGMRSVPQPVDDSATVWTTLDAEDPAPTSALSPESPSAGHLDASDPSDPEPLESSLSSLSSPLVDSDGDIKGIRDIKDNSAGDGGQPAGAGASDARDREAHLEHSSAAEDAEAEPATSDADGPAPFAALSEGPESSSAAEAPSAPSTDLQYQDTVDLTPLPGFSGSSPDSASEPGASSADGSASPSSGRSETPTKSRSKRASMPSWDEIVFGSKHE
ncbi:septation protein SepH [Brachybacterium alimentarium]|uniref:septation protein SepH n=1 Tax=Brachybacterium alimentarium TaxID=47845 RepID=UPI003FD3FA61